MDVTSVNRYLFRTSIAGGTTLEYAIIHTPDSVFRAGVCILSRSTATSTGRPAETASATNGTAPDRNSSWPL